MVMNERIRELATEVGMSVEYLESTKQIVLIERFAELIVQEFIVILEEEIKLVEEFKSTAIKADVIKCHQSKIWHFHKLIDKSKKHFGVEE
jgi:hypothetical protein